MTPLVAQGPGTSWSRVGSDLCLQTQFHRFHDCCLLVSGVCLLVHEAGSQLSVGRAMSRGGCGLRKSLGSFSVDWWGCVLTLWWFGLRHPSIGAYGLLGGAISAHEPSKRSTCSRSSYR